MVCPSCFCSVQYEVVRDDGIEAAAIMECGYCGNRWTPLKAGGEAAVTGQGNDRRSED